MKITNLHSMHTSGPPPMMLSWSERFARPKNVIFGLDPYIRLLNQILRTEKGAIEVYEMYGRCEYRSFHKYLMAHQAAILTLQRLIFENRGVRQKERFSFPTEFSKAFAKVTTKYQHNWLGDKATQVHCLGVEKALLGRYRQAYMQAPQGDKAYLDALARATNEHMTWLERDFPTDSRPSRKS